MPRIGIVVNKIISNDILHYQKIIIALFETDRLMKEIDNDDLPF